MLMQYLPEGQRKGADRYKQGDFTLYDSVDPDGPEQKELKRKYEEERAKEPKPYIFRVSRGTCQQCGQTFYKVRYGRAMPKYCSERCTNDAYIMRRRQRHAAALLKTCAVCGKEYTARKQDSIYCGPACKQRAYRNRAHLSET